MECIIGTAQLYLQPLAYLVEVHEQLSVSDYAGREVGILNLEALPCHADTGEPFADHEDVYIDSPQEMLGRPFAFVLLIPGARGLPSKFTVSLHLSLFSLSLFSLSLPQDIHVKFRMFVDETDSCSEKVPSPVNPNWNYRRVIRYSHATQELIDYLKEGLLHIELWGRQLLKAGFTPNAHGAGTLQALQHGAQPTKQRLQDELDKYGHELMGGFKMNGRVIDPNKQSIIVELLLMKKQQARMHQRIVSLESNRCLCLIRNSSVCQDNIKKLIDISEKQKRRFVSVDILKELVFTTTAESADVILTHMLNGKWLDSFY